MKLRDGKLRFRVVPLPDFTETHKKTTTKYKQENTHKKLVKVWEKLHKGGSFQESNLHV